MKRVVTLMAAGSLLAAFSLAQPGKSGYTVVDLGRIGTSPGGPSVVADDALAGGSASTPDGTVLHAVLWYKGQTFDLGKAGVGHPNSVALGLNNRGEVVGHADTISTNGANDFCGYNADGFPSATACLPFLWQNGVMKPLPTLGGANGIANKINNHGQAVGLAETSISDAGCPVSRFEPVVWEYGGVRRLSISLPGSSDAYGLAAAINDNGQIVGSSGKCGPFFPPAQDYLVENHALLWDRDGTPHDLGNLGGAGSFAGNHACSVNNRGQVAGHSDLKGNTAFHGFLWTEASGMVDLGALPGDPMSLANGINDAGVVVGASIGTGLSTFSAVRWDNGVISDLNKLVTANSSGLYLLVATWVNSGGEITGVAAGSDGLHAFLATPGSSETSSLASQSRPVLTGPARELVIRRAGLRLH